MTDNKHVINIEFGPGCTVIAMVFSIVAVIALISIMIVFGGG